MAKYERQNEKKKFPSQWFFCVVALEGGMAFSYRFSSMLSVLMFLSIYNLGRKWKSMYWKLMAKFLRSKEAKLQGKRSHPGDQKGAMFVSIFYLSFHHSAHSVALENTESLMPKRFSFFFFFSPGSDIINTAKPKRVGKFTVHWNWCVFLVPRKTRKECSFLFNLKSYLNNILSVVRHGPKSKTLHPSFRGTVKNHSIPTVRLPGYIAN